MRAYGCWLRVLHMPCSKTGYDDVVFCKSTGVTRVDPKSRV